MVLPDAFPATPDTARQTAGDALAAMEPEEQQFLLETAQQLIAKHEHGQLFNFDGLRLDLEEQLAIWFLLPSHIRSAIKREQQAARMKK
jgi:hypothetical protein